MALLEGTWTGMRVGGTIDGKEVVFAIAELLDLVTNGMIFHEAQRHQQAVEMFAKGPRWYLWPVIHFKIIQIKNAAVMLFRYLLRDGILDEADYPEAWRSAQKAWEAAKKESA